MSSFGQSIRVSKTLISCGTCSKWEGRRELDTFGEFVDIDSSSGFAQGNCKEKGCIMNNNSSCYAWEQNYK